jgi:hypothetical protein
MICGCESTLVEYMPVIRRQLIAATTILGL